MKPVVIVDYGLGNVGSIGNMLKRIGVQSELSSSPQAILDAHCLILPGVGAFDHGMAELEKRGLVETLNEAVLRRRIPILGICLGMQLMTRSSEEGRLKGLGWIEAKTVRIRPTIADSKLKVPHMGWNTLSVQAPHELLGASDREYRYYFVHSFCVQCDNPSDVVATTTYGGDFVSVFGRGNIFGVQFHPEKSHKYGMQLLCRFLGVRL